MKFRLCSEMDGNDFTDNQRILKLVSDDEKITLNLYFSYETLVGCNNCIAENKWSQTTGKFLAKLEPNPKNRAPHEYVLKFASEKLHEIAIADAVAIERKLLKEKMDGEEI